MATLHSSDCSAFSPASVAAALEPLCAYSITIEWANGWPASQRIPHVAITVVNASVDTSGVAAAHVTAVESAHMSVSACVVNTQIDTNLAQNTR